MNVPGSVVIRHEIAGVAQEQKSRSGTGVVGDKFSSEPDSEHSASISTESAFKPPESYHIPTSGSFPHTSGPAVCVVQMPQSYTNLPLGQGQGQLPDYFPERSGHVTVSDQERFVRSVDLVDIGGVQSVQMPFTVPSVSVPIMMQSQSVPVSSPSPMATINQTSFQQQTVPIQGKICAVMAPSEDLHICGRCKLQFNNVDHFIRHKQQGCQISRPVSQQEVVMRPQVQQQPLISQQEQESLSGPTSDETTSNITVVSEISESQVGAPQVGGDSMPSEPRLDVPVHQTPEVIQPEPMEQEIERLLEESHTAKNLPKPKQPSSRLAPVKKYSCEFADCTYMTAYQKDLERHWRVHTGDRPYHCEHCERSFTRLDHLKLHKYSHTGGKPYQCPQCNYSTAEKSALKKHIRIHTGEKPYKCQMCPYASRNSSQLIVHLRSHTGDAPFQCHICPSKFKINSDLKRHMRTHTGEKPFSCDMCDYKCAVKGNLQIHVKINHSGDNQYKCEEQGCDFAISSQKLLREHQKIHLGDQHSFQCGECQYLCSTKSSLRNHMVTHSEERPFKCGYCTHSSKQRGNMKNHLMRKHPEQLPLRKRKKEKADTLKKSPHKTRPLCKTSFDCSVCGDGFVREDSYKSHMKQHKELAIVMEDTALAVLQLQTPVTNIVRACAASGGETQEATVSSSSEAEARGEGVRDLRQFVHEGSDGPLKVFEVSGGKASVGAVTEQAPGTVLVDNRNAQLVTSNQPGYVSMESSFIQGNAPAVILESSSGKQIVVQVSGAPPGPQSQMVPGGHMVTVPAGGNLNYVPKGTPQTLSENHLTTVQNVLASGSVAEPSFYTTAAFPSTGIERVQQVGQIQSVYSNTTTTAVASFSSVPQQMSTAAVSSGQGHLQSTVQPLPVSNSPQIRQFTSASSSISNVPPQGRRVRRRTMSTNSAIKITHTPLKKTKKQTVRSILSPSSQTSAAAISHQPVMQIPGPSPQVVYRSTRDNAGIVSDGNSVQVQSHGLPGHQVVVQVPVGENTRAVDGSGRPVFVQTPNSDCHFVGPSAPQNQTVQMQGSDSRVGVNQPVVMQVPQNQTVQMQGSDSRVGVNQPVVMQVPVSVDNPSLPMQMSPGMVPPGQSQMMLAMSPGTESGICYRLVPQVAAPDGSITYSLLPQPYMPRENQALSPVTSQPASQVQVVPPLVQPYAENSEVKNHLEERQAQNNREIQGIEMDASWSWPFEDELDESEL
ncbi:uncharacterized protein LOC135496329 isoform X2 [Lineus longissimus]|uniref:uncharacterized protein LOC135496329 isoform X2 n=1 Tax=Lineus longissimus TaxID=88925 RepID=UPI00315CD928